MIGHQPAAVGLVDLDPKRPQAFGRRQDVAVAAPPPEREDRRMLQQQERIGNLPAQPRLPQPPLERQRLGVGDESEGDYVAGWGLGDRWAERPKDGEMLG